MGRYLPIIIPVSASLFFLIFGYFYLQAGKSSNTGSSKTEFSFQGLNSGPNEVPKNLPDQTRIENLESSVSSFVDQLSGLKTSIATASSEIQTSAMTDFRLKALEASALELKIRVAALEKPTPKPASESVKPPLYIPLGAGGESNDQNWFSMTAYQVIIDPAEYPGYTNVYLEVNMKLNQASGTGYARLYNVTDGKAVSSEISTTSDQYSLLSSAGFTLSTGKKTYQLQLKSVTGTIISIQNARLKIIF